MSEQKLMKKSKKVLIVLASILLVASIVGGVLLATMNTAAQEEEPVMTVRILDISSFDETNGEAKIEEGEETTDTGNEADTGDDAVEKTTVERNLVAGKEAIKTAAKYTSGVTTYINSSNTVTLQLDGTDDTKIKTSSLTSANIVVKVGGTTVTPTTKNLSTATPIEHGYRYTLTLAGIPGNGVLTIEIAEETLTDESLNKSAKTIFDSNDPNFQEIIIDNQGPEVTFGTNGSTTYTKSNSTTVTVADSSSGVVADSLKYVWTNSTTAPANESSFTGTFTNGGTVSTPASVTGDNWYLWILAKDNVGNTSKTKSNAFYLDNQGPQNFTVTAKYNNSSGSAYVEGTWAQKIYVSLSATDAHSGIKAFKWGTGSSWGTSSMNQNGDTANITFTANRNNQTIKFIVYDNLDNPSEIITVDMSIDKNPPTVTASDINYGETLNITLNDSYSGVSAWQIKSGSGTTAPTSGWTDISPAATTSNQTATGLNAGTYTIWAKDQSGRTAYKTITVNKIKLDTPTVSIDLDGKVTWPAVTNATGYQIKFAENEEWQTATSGSKYVNKTSAGTKTAYVQAINSDTTNYINSDAGSNSVEVYSLTLSKGTGISAVSNGGTSTTNACYYVSGKQVAIDATVGEGHTWSTWTKSAGTDPASATTKSTTVTIGANTTLTASATVNTYTVAYAGMDGATYGTNHPTSATYGVQFTVNNPTKTGHSFTGWKITGMDSVTHTYGSSTTTQTSISSTKETTFKNLRSTSGTVTFTAQWSVNNYTITYNYNGVKNYAIPTTASGSTTKSSFNGAQNQCTTIARMFTDELTASDKVTVTCDVSYTNLTAAEGKTAEGWGQAAGNRTSWSPSLGGGTHKAWIGTGSETYSYTTTMSADKIKNEYFSIAIRMDYYASGSITFSNIRITRTTTESSSKAYATQLGTLPSPVETGYTLDGWYTEATGGTKISDTTTVPAQNTTYYAHWTLNSAYTIAYAGMDGATYGTNHPTSATYGTDVTINNPKKTGYTFTGWSSSAEDGLSTITAIRGPKDSAVSTTYAIATIGTTANPYTLWNGTATKNTYFRNLRKESGTVTLTANWTANPLTFTDQTINKNYNPDATNTFNVTVASNGTGSYKYEEVSEKNATTNANTSYITITNAGAATIAKATPAGTYTYVIRATDNNSGATKDATYSVVIAKIASTNPTLADVTATYDGTAHQISITANGSGGTTKFRTSTDDSTWGDWSTTIPSLTNVGKLYVQAMVTGDENHNNTTATASKSITITKKPIAATIGQIESWVYDGQPHSITVTVTEPTSNCTVYYKEGTQLTSSNYSTTGSTTNPTYTDFTNGNKTIYYYVHTTNGNYSDISGSKKVNITKKTLTVTAKGASKIQGNADPVFTYTNSGAISGETAGFSGALTREAGEALGTYAITQGTLALATNGAFKPANYEMSFTGANFIINLGNYSITANGTTTYYDTLKNACLAVQNNQTIVATSAEINETEAATNTKTGVKLNVNGNKINLGANAFTNTGSIDIYSSVNGAILEGSATNVVKNSGTLTTNATDTKTLTIRNTSASTSARVLTNDASKTATLNTNTTLTHGTKSSGDRYVISNSGILYIAGASVNYETNGKSNTATWDRGIMNETTTSRLEMSAGSVDVPNTGIYNKGTGTTTPAVKIYGESTIVKSSVGSGIYNYAGGTVKVEGGELSSTSGSGLTNNGAGAYIIDGGTISSVSSYAIQNNSNGQITISDGTFRVTGTNTSAYTINNKSNGIITIKGGTVTCSKSNPLRNSAGGTFNIENGTITSPNGYSTIVNASTGVVNISGGSLTSTGAQGAYNSAGGTINVRGGTISGNNGLYNNGEGTLNVTGGIITGTNGDGVRGNTGAVTIGTNEATPDVSIDTPDISGSSYGVSTTGTFNFYDGILKGANNKTMSKQPTNKPSGYTPVTTAISGSTTRQQTVLGPGPITLTLKLTDANGNTYTPDTWTKENVYAEATVENVARGITQYEWKEGTGAWKTTSLTTSSNKGTITFTAARNSTISFRAYDGKVYSNEVSVKLCIDKKAPVAGDITGGTDLKATTQTVTLTANEGGSSDIKSGIVAYYFGTKTSPAAADYTSVESTTNFSTTADITAEGTYNFFVKDKAGNVSTKKSITIVSYTVTNLLEKIAGTRDQYKNTNYESKASNTFTYIIKQGTSLTLNETYTVPTPESDSTNFKGVSTTFTSSAATLSNDAPAASATTYYMWFNRKTFTVSVTKPTNGTVKAETVTQASNSVTASTAAVSLTVKYGDTVKGTATLNSGYSFTGWSGGYLTGNTSPSIGGEVTANKTITGSFGDNTKPVGKDITGGTALKATTQTLTIGATDGVGVTKYYWGTETDPADSAYTTITSTTDFTTTVDVTAAGTYNFYAKDAAGLVSDVKSITIVSYTVNNLLEKVDGTTDSYKSTDYASSASNTYIIKEGTSLTLNGTYTIPTGSDATKFKGVSTTFGTNAATLSNDAPNASADTTYYMWFNRLTYALTLNSGTGISATSGAGTYKYNKQVSIDATVKTGYTWSTWTKNSGNNPAAAGTKATTVTVTQATTLTASATANTYNITYDYDGGLAGTNAPATGTYDANVQISNPTRSGYRFAGWIATSGLNTSTAKYGTSSSAVSSSWNSASSPVTAEYFKNLTPTKNATVALKATWTANTVTININKDGVAWTESGIKVTLYDSTPAATSFTDTVSSGSTVTFTAVPNGTYTIYAGKDSSNKESLITSGATVTVNNNDPTAVTLNYYGVTLQKGSAINTVSNGGTSTTDAKFYLYKASGTQQDIAINATLVSNATWVTWEKTSGTNPATFTAGTQSQNIKLGAGKVTLTAKAIGKPTITRSDYNTFTYTAAGGAAYYIDTQNTTAPAAGTTAASDTFALRTWTTATSTGDLTLEEGKTYYVWAKSATTGGVVSKVSDGLAARKITRTQGDGTTLTTKRDATTASNGTAFTSATLLVLNGTKVSAGSALATNSGYNTPKLTIKIGTAAATDYTTSQLITISADTTITSSATANKVTVTLKKDGSAWSASGMKVSVRNSTISTTDLLSGTATSGSTAILESTGTNTIVVGTTYYVFISKDSNNINDMIYSGVSFTGAAGATVTVNYYTLTVNSVATTVYVNGTTVANAGTVALAGGTATKADNYAHEIVAAANTGYTFSGWTAGTGTPTIADTTIDTTTVKVGAASTITATSVDTTAPVISVSPSSATICKTQNVIISAIENGSGLASTNSYQYQLGTSATTVPTGTWNDYTSGVQQTIGTDLNGTYYLWVKEVKDNANNTSSTEGTKQSTYHVFGSYEFDNTVPTCTITSSPNSNITNATSITYTFTWNETLADGSFTIDDINVTNGTKGTFTEITANKVYTLVVTRDIDGTQTVTVDENTCMDLVGNNNIESSKSITIDTVAPVLESINVIDPVTGLYSLKEQITCEPYDKGDVTGDGIINNNDSVLLARLIVGWRTATEQEVYAGDLDNDGSLTRAEATILARCIAGYAGYAESYIPNAIVGTVITIEATYSENVYADSNKTAITSATAPELKVAFGGTIGVRNEGKATFSSVNNNKIIYTYQITRGDNGLLTSYSYSGTVYDQAGNSLSVSNKTLGGYEITADTEKPTCTITASPSGRLINSNTVTYTFTWSEELADGTFTKGDINIYDNIEDDDVSLSGYTLQEIVENQVYSLTMEFTQSVDLEIYIDDEKCNDLAGNKNNYENLYQTIDLDAPTCTITQSSSGNVTTYTFTWSEDLANGTFTSSDITVTNGTKGTFTETTANRVYTLAVTGTGGAITVTVPADCCTDLAGNGNIAVSTNTTIDITPPTIGGEVVANIDSSNQLTITIYSAADNVGGSGIKSYKVYNGNTLLASSTSNSVTVSSNTAWYTADFTVAVIDNADNECAKKAIDYYTVGSQTNLQGLRASVNNGGSFNGRTVRQIADITITETNWTPIGTDSTHTFSGTYYGGSVGIAAKTQRNITNLKAVDVSGIYTGLFGRVSGANISYIKLVNADVEFTTSKDVSSNADASTFVGQIAAHVYNSTITNCENDSDSKAINYAKINSAKTTYLGGLFGYVEQSTIQECTNKGQVKAHVADTNYSKNAKTGGVIGYVYSHGTELYHLYNYGTVVGNYDTGGIVGCAEGSQNSSRLLFDRCHNYGSVTMNAADYNVRSVGGIVGHTGECVQIIRSNNHTEGVVTASQSQHDGTGFTYGYAGGIVGHADASIIGDGNHSDYLCTNQGSVIGNVGGAVGGIAGRVRGGIVSYASNTGSVSGNGTNRYNNACFGGIVGFNEVTHLYYCTNTGSVTSSASKQMVGGIAGYNHGLATSSYDSPLHSKGATIYYCINSGNVSGSKWIGGIAGYNDGSVRYATNTTQKIGAWIQYCTTNGSATISGTTEIGGIVGNNIRGIVEQCTVTGTATVGGSGVTKAGGIVGRNTDYIHKCTYSSSSAVTGTSDIGGIAGESAIYDGQTIESRVQDSKVTAGSVSGTSKIGGIVGHNYNLSTVQRNTYSSSSGVTAKDYAGGIVGYSDGGAVASNTYSGTGQVKATEDYAGGIVGYAVSTPISSNTYSGSGLVTAVRQAGGIVGYSNGSVISNTKSAGAVTASGNYAGGIIALTTTTTVTNSNTYSSSSAVTGADYTGGIIGKNQGSASSNKMTYGSVSGSGYVGGIAGFNSHATFSGNNHSASGTISGVNYVGGIVGKNEGTVSGSVKTGGGVSSSSIDIGGIAGWNTGTVQNCTPGAITVSGPGIVGGVVGISSGTINNCNVIDNLTVQTTAAITDNSKGLGGIAGYNSGTVQNCQFHGTVKVSGNTGGIVGWQNSGTISKCSCDGTFAAGYTANNNGGIVGNLRAGTVQECSNRSNVNYVYGTGIRNSSIQNVGGIAGLQAGGTIQYCYNRAANGGFTSVGGLIGYMTGGTVKNSYSIEKMYTSSSSKLGTGLVVGTHSSGTIETTAMYILEQTLNSNGTTTTNDFNTYGNGVLKGYLKVYPAVDSNWNSKFYVDTAIKNLGYPILQWENSALGSPVNGAAAVAANTVYYYACGHGTNYTSCQYNYVSATNRGKLTISSGYGPSRKGVYIYVPNTISSRYFYATNTSTQGSVYYRKLSASSNTTLTSSGVSISGEGYIFSSINSGYIEGASNLVFTRLGSDPITE